jgi:hypothetical protein
MTRALGTIVCGFVVLLGCGGSQTSVKVSPMPDGAEYGGVYHSQQYGEMHVIQNGNAVHGEYKKDEREGTFEGEVEGNVLRFAWVEMKAMVSNRPTETRGRGYFQYFIDPANDDHVIKGRWGLGDDDSSGGEWTAYKMKGRVPERGFARGGAGTEEGSSDEGGSESSGGESESEESSDNPDDIF